MDMTITQIKSVLKNPAKAAKYANLIYITDNKLTIQRHKYGRGFFYTLNEIKIKDKKSIKRFKGLVIPPAWKDVRITPLVNGHLQVVGRDEKNRKQYRYHPSWSKFRNETKFFKMVAFGNVLPKIRAQVEKDLEPEVMTKLKCLALIIKLMEETHIRIGNEYYAKRNKTYGLSTMRTKHLELQNKDLRFHFIGKKGKEHSISIQDQKLQKLVLECKEIPGWELFQYYDQDNYHHSIDSGMVNDYISEISGVLFSAKDFRTWSGSKIFFMTLKELGLTNNKDEIKSNLKKAFKITSEALGNTPNVCKKYYVHPAIVSCYENGIIKKAFKEIDNLSDSLFFSSAEQALLNIYQKYTIEI
ncbi:DNA topoisomerase [Patiriisocius marinistellae]|uniref:DNA topoisomerase n=1 Tax=Patiriisocius marinistellae TaxID=2494560 RepID=A0A5J4G0U4_9FLAO|nr:DNA topoisomerase IB [Patiriisocius marinistellae]GEQ87164.1 DNA topoisomerase [Patiriisocius marinistellae]